MLAVLIIIKTDICSPAKISVMKIYLNEENISPEMRSNLALLTYPEDSVES